MGGPVNTLLIYLNFMDDMWIISYYLNGMFLKHDEEVIYFLWLNLYM